jgi:UDP-N-acetylglucosamine/UDP-N-acetylgalactosamine diphosphorylase
LVVVFLFIISKFFNGRSESTSTPLPTVAVPAPTPKAPPKRTSPLDALRPKYNDAGQGQVFKYADEGKLTPAQETALAAQLSKLDLARIAKLHKDAMAFDAKGQSDLGKLEPLDSYDSIESSSAKQKKQWTDRGYDSISRGECAALVLAGGAGSRLGFEFPKGMYDIGLPSKKPLYQLFAERLRMLSHLASKSTGSPERAIPWYVMTSEGDNHTHTTKFFEDNKYFGYGKQNVVFFSQGTLPCMTLEGKIMLESGCKVGAAADGNGGVYAALQKTGQLMNMATRGVKYVHCFSVDNAIGKVSYNGNTTTFILAIAIHFYPLQYPLVFMPPRTNSCC